MRSITACNQTTRHLSAYLLQPASVWTTDVGVCGAIRLRSDSQLFCWLCVSYLYAQDGGNKFDICQPNYTASHPRRLLCIYPHCGNLITNFCLLLFRRLRLAAEWGFVAVRWVALLSIQSLLMVVKVQTQSCNFTRHERVGEWRYSPTHSQPIR